MTRLATTLLLTCLSATSSQGCGADPAESGKGGGSGSSDSSSAGTGDTGSATGSGASNSDSAGGGGGSPGAASTACGQFSIANGRVTPDMLIVLDRSSSMQGQDVDRWNPSVAGIKAITGELDDVIRFGLMAFPGRGSDTANGGGMSCAPGTLEVPIALAAAPAVASSLDGLSLVQSTPTAATLAAAHAALASSSASAGATSKYVILVTDGAPNCSSGDARGGGGGGQDTAAVAASVAAIAAMNSDDIKTYVLGYGTQTDPMLKAALDQMAQAGGTGATAHRAIEDEAGLIQEFRSIIGTAAVGCTFALMTPPSDPNYVRVALDGVKLEFDSPEGFVLNADRSILTVQGAACKKLQSSMERHVLDVSVECERQTPLF